MKKGLLVISFLLMVLSLNIQASEGNRERYLIIHTFSHNFSLTKNIQKGIQDVLNEDHPNAIVNIEYMDMKTLNNTDFDKTFREYLKKKYAYTYISGIIISNDPGLKTLLSFKDDIFPGVPVVACGISMLTKSYMLSSIDSFIFERPDFLGCFDNIRSIYPELKAVNLVYNSMNVTDEFLRSYYAERMYVGSKVNLKYYDSYNDSDMQQQLAALDSNDVIFLIPSSAKERIDSFHFSFMEKELSLNSNVPVFVGWDYQIGNGVLGGSVIDSVQMGRQAMKTLGTLTSGGKPERYIYKYENMHKQVYDDKVLERFGIDKKRLPQGAVIINRPPSFISSHPVLILILIFSLFFLVFFFTDRYRELKKHQVITEQKQKILSLREEYLDSQVELIETLGEVIEKRSKETSAHVKRVAMISSLLALKSGMDEAKASLLESASPMHDVGKISVPDYILEKPGVLTKNEFEIMKDHTVNGFEILNNSTHPLFELARTIAYSHHENWDGSGYPLGLKGERIPIEARITRIVDVFDALLSDRPYKKPWKLDDVVNYMVDNRCILFDPELLDIFIENISEVIELFWSLEDSECFKNLLDQKRSQSVSPVKELL